MSLYKRGAVWHYDFTVHGARYRGSTQQTAKAAAARFEARERERASLGRPGRVVPTFGDAGEQWFRARCVGKKSVKAIKRRLKVAMRLIGEDTLVNEIGPQLIEEAMLARSVELSPHGKIPSAATLNRDLIDTTTRPILNYARTVMEAPVKAIDWSKLRRKEPPGRAPSFSEETIMAWREALPEWHRPVFDFIRRYAVRLREAFFSPDAYLPDTQAVIVRYRKNGQPHLVQLLPEDAADIAARVGRAQAAEPKLNTVWFKDGKDGLEPITWRGFESASERALEVIGLTGVRPVHDLRHHAATSLLRRSKRASLAHVKKLLGHESIQSTMRYAHVEGEDVRDALRHAYDTEAQETPETSMKSTARKSF